MKSESFKHLCIVCIVAIALLSIGAVYAATTNDNTAPLEGTAIENTSSDGVAATVSVDATHADDITLIGKVVNHKILLSINRGYQLVEEKTSERYLLSGKIKFSNYENKRVKVVGKLLKPEKKFLLFFKRFPVINVASIEEIKSDSVIDSAAQEDTAVEIGNAPEPYIIAPNLKYTKLLENYLFEKLKERNADINNLAVQIMGKIVKSVTVKKVTLNFNTPVYKATEEKTDMLYNAPLTQVSCDVVYVQNRSIPAVFDYKTYVDKDNSQIGLVFTKLDSAAVADKEKKSLQEFWFPSDQRPKDIKPLKPEDMPELLKNLGITSGQAPQTPPAQPQDILLLDVKVEPKLVNYTANLPTEPNKDIYDKYNGKLTIGFYQKAEAENEFKLIGTREVGKDGTALFRLADLKSGKYEAKAVLEGISGIESKIVSFEVPAAPGQTPEVSNQVTVIGKVVARKILFITIGHKLVEENTDKVYSLSGGGKLSSYVDKRVKVVGELADDKSLKLKVVSIEIIK